jgi:cation diffusion facilitator family transporter
MYRYGNGTDSAEFHRERFAMHLSLGVGAVLLVLKLGAYWLTSSAAIFSDAAESVIHVVAVSFAVFSLHLSYRPPNSRFHYGYEKIAFFSAGVEGGLISLAAIAIFVLAGRRLLTGEAIENLGPGMALITAASLLTGFLGLHLIRLGKRQHSLVLEANGRHVATDSITSFGVVGGLLLVKLTGWQPLDPLVAFAVATQILYSGAKMIHRSLGGLMDWVDPEADTAIRQKLPPLATELGLRFHELRFRNMGRGVHLEMHLLFPYAMPLGEAHRKATELERRLSAALPFPILMTTHLESLEDHAELHPEESLAMSGPGSSVAAGG